MTNESLALIASYFLCSEAAETLLLDRAEVETCTSTYTAVKLSFLPDVDATDYAAMTAVERAEVNQRGYVAYVAYVAWRAANPTLVSEMEAEARHQLFTSDS